MCGKGSIYVGKWPRNNRNKRRKQNNLKIGRIVLEETFFEVFTNFSIRLTTLPRGGHVFRPINMAWRNLIGYIYIYFVSTQYFLNRLKVFGITPHKCSPYWNDVLRAYVTTTLVQGQGHMTIFRFRSITFEPLEGFWNKSPQMFTILTIWTEHILQSLWFRVKVVIRGQRSHVGTFLQNYLKISQPEYF